MRWYVNPPMEWRSRISLLLAVAVTAALLAPAAAGAITSEQMDGVTLRDDLQRSDPPSGFSSSGAGAGKWSKPGYIYVTSIGGAYNTGGRLGYGSPSFLSSAYWNAQSFKDTGNGVAVEATLNSKLGNGESVAIVLNQPSPSTTESGYELLITGSSNPIEGAGYIYKFTGGTLTLLKSGVAYTATGTRFGLVEKNGELSAWAKSGGIWATPTGYQVTDPTPFKEGYAGLAVLGTGPSLDNFSAGPLPPSKPSVTSTSPVSPNASTTPSVIGSAEAGTTVNIFNNSSCSGKALATGTAAAFNSAGIGVSVEKESTTTFYASVTNSESVASACSTSSVAYVQHTPPAAPTFSSSNPASPANNNAPRIIGSAVAGSTAKLYTNSSCAGSPVATGTAAAFASPGLAVSVADNTTTTFYATATDAVGGVSSCSTSSLAYQEDSTGLLAEGSFEEGTLNHWNIAGVGEVVPAVTNADARTGSYSADIKLTGSQNRSELIFGGNGSGSTEGQINFGEADNRYYAFSFKIIEMVYGKPGGHNLIMQFKSEGEGSPNFGLQLWNVKGEKGLWTGGPSQEIEHGGERFLAPVSEGQWHDVVIHFIASAKGTGSYETYLDGTKIDSAANVSMIVPGKKTGYIKNGIYRNGETVPGTSEIRLDNAKLGSSLASVGGLGHP